MSENYLLGSVLFFGGVFITITGLNTVVNQYRKRNDPPMPLVIYSTKDQAWASSIPLRISRTNILGSRSWSSYEEWQKANDAAWALIEKGQFEGFSEDQLRAINELLIASGKFPPPDIKPINDQLLP